MMMAREQKSSSEELNNVIDIFSRKARVSTTEENETEDASLSDFVQVMTKNRDVQERLREERLKANDKVLKSYKIKKKS